MDSDILDDIDRKKTINFYSKTSVVIVSLFLSPLYGGILYCINLYNSGQKEKVIGTSMAIMICNFYSVVPFIGFKLGSITFNPSLFIHHIVMTLLMIFPLWKIHFKRIKYKSTFSAFTLIVILLIFGLSAFLNFNILKQGMVIIYAVIIRFLYLMVQPKKS